EAEYVAAHLDVALVVGPPRHEMWRAAVVSANGLGGKRRHVGEVVGRLVGRRDRRERTIAEERVGLTAGMEVPFLPGGAGQWPLALVAPGVAPHDEETKRRLVDDAVGDALEPVVEPAKLERFEINLRGCAEVDVARARRRA